MLPGFMIDFFVQTAINARRDMVNDIGAFTDDNPYLPSVIWWPLKPEESALGTLAERCPSMHEQIAIAAIYCDYQSLYESINIRLCGGPMEAAKQVGNMFYLEDLQKRAAELGISDIYSEPPQINLERPDIAIDVEPTGLGIYPRLCADLRYAPCHSSFYRYGNAFGGYVERYAWLSFETIRKIDCEWGEYEYFISNDARWFETHELGKDENGRDLTVQTPTREQEE